MLIAYNLPARSLSRLTMRLGTSKGAGSVLLREGQAIRLDEVLSAGLEGPLED